MVHANKEQSDNAVATYRPKIAPWISLRLESNRAAERLIKRDCMKTVICGPQISPQTGPDRNGAAILSRRHVIKHMFALA